MTTESRDQLLLRYKGCILGAILGDALAMPHETLSIRSPGPLAFGNAYRGHPHEMLFPGQYTDDGQIILMAARILVESKDRFNVEDYAKELLRTNRLHKFRYADGTVISACRKMEETGDLLKSGITSDTAGCIALAVPFALAYTDRREMAKALSEVCIITHTGAKATAGTIALALLLHTLIDTAGNLDAAFTALDTAAKNMFPDLIAHLAHAYRAAENRVPPDTAALQIGTTSQITQVLSLAAYLCKSIKSSEQLLSTAVSLGGNCGTVATICGAIAGARFGIIALPLDLIRKVERAGIFEELATALFNRAHPVPAPEKLEKKNHEVE